MSESTAVLPAEFEGIPRTRVAATLLMVLAAVIAVLSLLNAGFQLSALGERPGVGSMPAAVRSAPATAYLEVLRALAAWLGGSALLWGLAEILRRVDDMPFALREATSRGTVSGGAWTGRGLEEETHRAQLAELAVLLREVRDISLLNQDERTIRLRAQAEESARELERAVPELLRSHNWIEARRRVQLARERFPAQSTWDTLERRIDEVRAGVEQQDVETARRQVNDLAALGAWERAFDVVRELLERHPENEAARELSHLVQNERGKADAEQRSRLMSQVQEAAQRREWSAALSAANALIRQYPTSAEARALRLDLPTLAENNEIQQRKRIESEITQLTRARRYNEALHLARDLIERYPRSPQAAVLRQKLPQLEARAGARAL